MTALYDELFTLLKFLLIIIHSCYCSIQYFFLSKTLQARLVLENEATKVQNVYFVAPSE